MKKSCSVALLVLFFALFANAQEQEVPPQEEPPPLPKDSSLAVTPDSSASPMPAPASKPEKIEKKAKEKKAEDYQQNLRVMAYFHPLPLFWGAAYNMFMFSSSFEIPLNLRNSIVVQPSVWFGSSDGHIPNITIFLIDNDGSELQYEKLKRVGSGIGIRHYALDKGQGFYLQAMASAYYFSAKSVSSRTDGGYWDERETVWNKVDGFVGELMFYLGSTHKWQNVGFFYEVGLGFGYDDTKTQQLGYINRLATNFNIGIGIPL